MVTSVVSDKQFQQLKQDGYVVFPQVLAGEEIDKIRASLEARMNSVGERLRKGNGNDALIDIYGRYPETRWLLYHSGVNDILRALLNVDSPVNLKATTLLRQTSSPWHNETTDLEESNHSFHLSKDCMLLQTVIYLQNNKGTYGPALDLDLGTHLQKDPFVRSGATLTYTPKNKFAPETAKGDLLVFDWRLNHRATPAQEIGTGAVAKLGVFGSYTNSWQYARLYNEYIESSKYEYLHNIVYDDEFVAEARANSIVMA